MTNYDDELYHHGIKGMKWGIRRYQNKDGSLTAAGRKKYKKIGQALKKTAYGLANVATLGTVGSIKKYEKNRKPVEKIGHVPLKALAYGINSYSTKLGLDFARLALATGASYAYLKSGGNQKVKKGAMILGRLFNTAAKATLATYAGYGIYDTVRSAKEVYDHKKNARKGATKNRKTR